MVLPDFIKDTYSRDGLEGCLNVRRGLCAESASKLNAE